jgi:hypothetical protein
MLVLGGVPSSQEAGSTFCGHNAHSRKACGIETKETECDVFVQ